MEEGTTTLVRKLNDVKTRNRERKKEERKKKEYVFDQLTPTPHLTRSAKWLLPFLGCRPLHCYLFKDCVFHFLILMFL